MKKCGVHSIMQGKKEAQPSVQFKNSLILLLTAVIWGSGFVAQSVGMDYIGPFTFTAIRNFLGAAVLLPLVLWKRTGRIQSEEKAASAKDTYSSDRKGQNIHNITKNTLTGGIFCGIFLCIASNFQQFGILYTTVGKAGFITALYVVFVPVLGLFLNRRATAYIWISVILSVIGLYLLCMKGGALTLQLGDLLELVCALMFSVHIMVIDHFTEQADSVAMSAVQFFVCGILSMICMLLFEAPDMGHILAAWKPILYAGVLASGAGYTLQVVGQQGVNPTVASLILCMESVVSALAGWLFLGQALAPRELAGCVLMFLAIVLAQLPVPEPKGKGIEGS